MFSSVSWRPAQTITALTVAVLVLAAASCSTAAAVDESIPVFIIAGQSNAEGAVRLAGLQGLATALPDGDQPLTAEQRSASRAAFHDGIGAMCEDDDPTPTRLADAAIAGLRRSALDLSSVDEQFTIPGAEIVAHRYQITDGDEPLYVITGEDNFESPMWDGDDPAPLGGGFGFISDEATFFGPELGFGLELQRDIEQFGVVKVTMSGSTLFDHWAPGSDLRAALFDRTQEYLDARPDHHVAAFIWFQGFSDQFEDFSIRDYDNNLHDLISDVRRTYGEDVAVIVVEARRPDDLPTLGLIADAQKRVVDDLSNAALVPTSGLTTCFHYDSASQLLIGQRIAKAWRNLHGQP